MKPYYKLTYNHLKDMRCITCKDVQNLTDSTSPHTIIKQLRAKGLLVGEPKKITNKNTWFFVHFTPKNINELI